LAIFIINQNFLLIKNFFNRIPLYGIRKSTEKGQAKRRQKERQEEDKEKGQAKRTSVPGNWLYKFWMKWGKKGACPETTNYKQKRRPSGMSLTKILPLSGNIFLSAQRAQN
jgi:hypothetical protein